MQIEFDTHGNEKQKQAAKYWTDNTTEQILYGGAKYGGKSYLGCSLIFGDALIYPGTRYFIARKELNDLRKYTTDSIHEVFKSWELPFEKYAKYNGIDNYFTLYNGSKVFYIACKYLPSDPKFARFGSMQMTRGWAEEIGEGVTEDAVANLFLSLGRWKNRIYGIKKKMLNTCNPYKGFAYNNFYIPSKKGELEQGKKFIVALPTDNKSGDPDYIQSLINDPDKNRRERLAFGNWEYDDNPNALIDYDNIMALFSNDHVTKDPIHYMTIDVARLGSDKARIGVWAGWVVIETQSFDISKTTVLQTAINALRAKYKIPKYRVIGDEDGVGGGLVDICGINGFLNGGAVLPVEMEVKVGNKMRKRMVKPPYQNLKTQCYYYYAEKVNSSEVWIACEMQTTHKEEIIQEHEYIQSYETDKDNKIKLLPKEKVKEKIGRSPDWTDMLMMRAWFDLKPKRKNVGGWA